MRERLIKPRFWSDEDLAELGPWHRLLFQGLWALADREGRLEDRPAWIRVQVFPYDQLEAEHNVSVGAMLDDLAQPRKHSHEGGGFIVRYEVAGRRYIEVRNFKRHQRPHPKEHPSNIPCPSPLTEKPRKVRGHTAACSVITRTSHSGPSVPSGSSEPSKPSVTKPAAVASGAIVAIPKPGLPDWNREFADDFREVYGGPPSSQLFAQVKVVAKRYGWLRTRPALRDYMAETSIEFLNVPKVMPVRIEAGDRSPPSSPAARRQAKRMVAMAQGGMRDERRLVDGTEGTAGGLPGSGDRAGDRSDEGGSLPS